MMSGGGASTGGSVFGRGYVGSKDDGGGRCITTRTGGGGDAEVVGSGGDEFGDVLAIEISGLSA